MQDEFGGIGELWNVAVSYDNAKRPLRRAKKRQEPQQLQAAEPMPFDD